MSSRGSRERRGSFTSGLTLPNEMQPDLALLAARGGKALKEFEPASQDDEQAAGSRPWPPATVSMADSMVADTVSASEEQRTSAAVSALVGDFHDRFWLPRDAAGDSAASSAAAAAALSTDPGQRSVAAHLYAVRTTQRLVKQVCSKPRPPSLKFRAYTICSLAGEGQR